MKVLLLTPRPQLFTATLDALGDSYDVSMATPDVWPNADMAISFGYRHIIDAATIAAYNGGIINIHMSMLPWNRGADPNFWSWHDNTPKGVTAHLVTTILDGGPIIGQMQVSKWRQDETLKTSYEFLNFCAGKLFEYEWPYWRMKKFKFITPREEGSYHKSSEKDALMKSLPLGWDTPVADIQGFKE